MSEVLVVGCDVTEMNAVCLACGACRECRTHGELPCDEEVKVQSAQEVGWRGPLRWLPIAD